MTPYHRGGCHQALSQPDRDGSGRPVPRGTACASCPGCDTPHGDVGLAGVDLRERLAVEDGLLQVIERATNGAGRCEDLRPDVDWAVLWEGVAS